MILVTARLEYADVQESVTTSVDEKMTHSNSNDVDANRIPKLALHLLAEDVRREALEYLEELHLGSQDPLSSGVYF